MDSDPAWLKYATLGADYLGPVVAALFGYWILTVTKRLESSQWKNQKLVEKRIEVWDKIGPLLNDIYCYCLRVGTWKAHTPPAIVGKKREADKLTHLSRPYFSDSFFSEYQAFMETCFQLFQGHGVDAKIRTESWEHQNAHSAWNDE